MAKVLIIDDDEAVLAALSGYLRLRGHEALAAADAAQGIELFERETPEIVLLDVFLKGKNGLDLLKTRLAREPGPGVIMISGHADVATAVSAIKLGAFDFLEKPIDTDRLDILIGNLSRELGFRRGIERLRRTWREENMFLGGSRAMREAVDIAERAASSALSVLITGENGTGKEIFARYIHMMSGRVGGPFIAVNCSALPPELIESALFGHRKGAFTGAHADTDGYFSAASGGSLFLDEIGELPRSLQPKLLRALENGEIQRVGSTAAERVDVRIISATNLSLSQAMRSGGFREDLFYRLSQLPIRVPALRERREDIRGLAGFFARPRGLLLSEEAFLYLEGRQWPGNIRELKNLIERAAVLARASPISGMEIRAIDATGIFALGAMGPTSAAEGAGEDSVLLDGAYLEAARAAEDGSSTPMSLVDAKRVFEKRYVEARLAAHRWSVRETAEELGMLPNNLSRKISELGIKLVDR